jgi:hypothetical protein
MGSIPNRANARPIWVTRVLSTRPPALGVRKAQLERSNLRSILETKGFEVLKTESIGHSFELKLLASRIRAVMPAIGAPIEWLLDVFPFLKRRTIYVNPRTKFIAYSRKRRDSG